MTRFSLPPCCLAPAFGLCLLLAAAGCAAPGADLPPLPPVLHTGYRLGTGDQVRIIVFGEDQLTGEFRVGASGAIDVPLLGAVPAAGKTPAQLGTEVGDLLQRRNLLHDPSVAVEVIEYRPVFVLGEVNHPGQFPYQPDMTMVTAVAVAGGFTYRAVQDRAAIMRATPDGPVEGEATRQSYVQPGDVVTILERRF
jgi:polysaccharide export outer membrane protein